jgi:hypothetical protein
VFKLDVKDDVSDGFGMMNMSWFTGKLSVYPVEYLFTSWSGNRVIDRNRYKVKLLCHCWTTCM